MRERSLHRPEMQDGDDAKLRRVDHVMRSAVSQGLIDSELDGNAVSVPVNARLLAAARKNTGIQNNAELMTFALASIALRDDFPAEFKRMRASIDEDIKLGL